MEIIAVSTEFWMWDLDQLIDEVAWSSFKSFVSHVLIFYQMVVRSTSRNLKIEVLDSLNDFLTTAEVALSANNLSSTLASWTNIRKDVIETVSKIHTACDSALTTTFLTRHDIVRIFCSSSSTIWASNLFFHHDWQSLAQIEVLQWQKHSHPQLRSLQTP